MLRMSWPILPHDMNGCKNNRPEPGMATNVSKEEGAGIITRNRIVVMEYIEFAMG